MSWIKTPRFITCQPWIKLVAECCCENETESELPSNKAEWFHLQRFKYLRNQGDLLKPNTSIASTCQELYCFFKVELAEVQFCLAELAEVQFCFSGTG